MTEEELFAHAAEQALSKAQGLGEFAPCIILVMLPILIFGFLSLFYSRCVLVGMFALFFSCFGVACGFHCLQESSNAKNYRELFLVEKLYNSKK